MKRACGLYEQFDTFKDVGFTTLTSREKHAEGEEKMDKPVLVILAAGMGSRYGGLKQIDPVDAQGHKIIDFSMYDAHRAGFEKVVFIIKKENEKDFRECVGDRVSRHMEVEYVFQELDKVPEGFTVPEGRTKPWGTSHAVLCARAEIGDAPFGVINADDYYGPEAFQRLYDFLVESKDSQPYEFCMIGYRLGNTVTDNGSVARGVCQTDGEGNLTSIVERTRIEKYPGGIHFTADEGKTWEDVPGDTPVSMNMWGFTPELFGVLEQGFAGFLAGLPDSTKGEYLIPTIVDGLIQEKKANVTVLESSDKWFGVTYKEDKPAVVRSFRELIDAGVYKEKLFD